MSLKNVSIGTSCHLGRRRIEQHLKLLVQSIRKWSTQKNVINHHHSNLNINQMAWYVTLGTRHRLLTSIQTFLLFFTPALRLLDLIVVRNPLFRIRVMMELLRLILLSARQLNHRHLQFFISLQNCHLRRNYAARWVSSLLGKLVRNTEEYPQLFLFLTNGNKTTRISLCLNRPTSMEDRQHSESVFVSASSYRQSIWSLEVWTRFGHLFLVFPVFVLFISLSVSIFFCDIPDIPRSTFQWK